MGYSNANIDFINKEFVYLDEGKYIFLGDFFENMYIVEYTDQGLEIIDMGFSAFDDSEFYIIEENVNGIHGYTRIQDWTDSSR